MKTFKTGKPWGRQRDGQIFPAFLIKGIAEQMIEARNYCINYITDVPTKKL